MAGILLKSKFTWAGNKPFLVTWTSEAMLAFDGKEGHLEETNCVANGGKQMHFC